MFMFTFLFCFYTKYMFMALLMIKNKIKRKEWPIEPRFQLLGAGKEAGEGHTSPAYDNP